MAMIGREEGLETLGPLGRSEGVAWKFTLDGPILEITVYYDQNFLRGISFQCKRSDDRVTANPQEIGRTNVGESKSGCAIKTAKVRIDSDEKLESISAVWDSSCLKSLTFATNRKTYGPYGSSRSFPDSTGGSIQMQGRVIAGFYVHHAGRKAFYTPTAIGVRVIRGGGNQGIVVGKSGSFGFGKSGSFGFGKSGSFGFGRSGLFGSGVTLPSGRVVPGFTGHRISHLDQYL